MQKLVKHRDGNTWKEGETLKQKGFSEMPFIPNLNAIAEYNNAALQHVFEGKIRGDFLIDIKDEVMKTLGLNNLVKCYDLRWSDERMITGIGEAAEYDICKMIVGIHRAYSIFLSDNEIRRNERSRKYKQQLISETLEKIQLRAYGSVYFRKKLLLQGEEFLYYPLPYELFVILIKMNNILLEGTCSDCQQLYYGVIYNSISALSLLEDNLFGTAYPLCRGAIEMHFKLLILASQAEPCNWYEEFRMFEVAYSCRQAYPEKFHALFENRICQGSKAKADYLHFGWVDYVAGYHEVVKKSPYSVYGIIAFLKDKNKDKIVELECLEGFYKSCHAYTHGSIQTAKYPVLHYFEISIMLYYIVRSTYLLLCKEKKVSKMIDGYDIISMIDRDFDILLRQHQMRSTEKFESYYNA